MRGLAVAVGIATAWILSSAPVAADVLVNVSKSSQRMAVLVDGSPRYNWLISTGRARYTTPNGVYKPEWMARKWRSKQYNNAPMPHSIFFHEGYAIHGTTEIATLGKLASHGCVRLHPENAAKLFALVQKQMDRTRVVVSNDAIDAPGAPPSKKPASPFVAENIPASKPGVSPAAGKSEPASAKSVRAEQAMAAAKNSEARDLPKAAPSRPAGARSMKRADASPGFSW